MPAASKPIVAAFIGLFRGWRSAVLVAIVAAVSVTFCSGSEPRSRATGAATVVAMVLSA